MTKVFQDYWFVYYITGGKGEGEGGGKGEVGEGKGRGGKGERGRKEGTKERGRGGGISTGKSCSPQNFTHFFSPRLTLSVKIRKYCSDIKLCYYPIFCSQFFT